MTDKVIIHGVEYVPKVVPEPEPAKVGRWRPDFHEYYYYISDNCRIFKSAWVGVGCDLDRHNLGNFYKTKELATRAYDRQLLLVELQDFADQKNGREELPKPCYFLIKDGNKWEWASSSTRNPGNIRFKNSVDADVAITRFGDRLDLLL